MSDAKTPPRPPQATFAGWVTIVGSVVVVLTSFSTVGNLRTLKTRESVESFLAEPPGSGLSLTVEQALQALHVSAMVGAGCAAAAAILGWQVLRRDRKARAVLSVLAVPLLVTGMITGGFMSTVVAVAALLMWMQPTRAWFDGVEWTRPQPGRRWTDASAREGSDGAPSAPGADGSGHDAPVVAPPEGTHTTEARAWQGFGASPAVGVADPTVPERRPAAVAMACTLTWVFSAVFGLLMLASMVIVALDPEYWIGELRKQNPEVTQQADVTDQMLTVALYFVGGVTLVWAVAAIVLAWFVLRRANWARALLIVSASVTAVFALVGSLTNPIMLVVLFAATITIASLLRPESRAWFRAGRPPAPRP